MIKRIIILILVLCIPVFAQAQNDNYCKDKESWKEWNELVQKHPHDMDIQMLHAVKIGFCKKIEDGTISFDVARDAFNHLHEIVFKKAKNEQNKYLKNKQL